MHRDMKISLLFCMSIFVAFVSLGQAARAQDYTEPTNEGLYITDTTGITAVMSSQIYMPLARDTGAEHVMITDVLTDVVSAAASTDEFGAFDAKRLPEEFQAWWNPAYGHIHFGVLVPLGGTVSGILQVPVRIVFHDNPSTLRYISVHTDKTQPILRIPMGNLTCLPLPKICAWSVILNIDTTKTPDGAREFRFRAETKTPDGKEFLNSSGVPIYVNNGGPISNYTGDKCNHKSLIGRAWYTSFNYTNALIECVFTAPVKGTITYRIRAQEASDHLTAELDKSHVIPATGIWKAVAASPGTVLFDKAGDFSGYNAWQTVIIDTTKLANGWHKLAVRSHSPKGAVTVCAGCPVGVVSHPEGVVATYFYVQN